LLPCLVTRYLTMLPRGLVLLPRVVALCCFQLLPRRLVHCFDVLPCYLYFKLFCYLYLLMPLIISLPFTSWRPSHLKYLLTPPHLLLHYLVASHLIPLLPCCLTTLHWLIIPFSLLFCREELEA
jgi:hypothetical protein